MTCSIDTWRRAVSIVLVVGCLVLVPQVAQAFFSARQAPVGTTVKVASVVTPTAVTGTYTCATGFFVESATVSFTGFDDTHQIPGVTYTFRIQKAGTNGGESVTTTAKRATVTSRQTIDVGATDYQVQITAQLGRWTRTWQREITCGFGNLPGPFPI
ncbi:hypothetical protein [Nocardioides marmotae]|uniref:Fibronectin type III domain-containing protein n=1 Tax=Nocardioides marmotae TaxID=2663857 RepID=A0A6I3JEA0_9ACTN|nr:hypothetical protein [Nocardioides marmotae]MCR6032787.1 hypothetical protein [Gordonia jinghuaiqii]MBC9735566.1 hypothetical protein [Nocardioides marmotae]MTB86662.1 hypothetical protein [Nocardioides marmotae]MTB96437.1 hypothetical protein [Nocardioides marmotae]QKE02037.1 hypothetical protein HPC71_13840 [Nocardioides marmotae]